MSAHRPLRSGDLVRAIGLGTLGGRLLDGFRGRQRDGHARARDGGRRVRGDLGKQGEKVSDQITVKYTKKVLRVVKRSYMHQKVLKTPVKTVVQLNLPSQRLKLLLQCLLT